MKKFFEGRINRLNYLGGEITVALFFNILLFALSSFIGSEFLNVVLGLVLLFFQISLAVRRLHDINLSGYFALIFLVPQISNYFGVNLIVVNIISVLILLLIKGNPVANTFGEVNSEKDLFKIIFPR